MKTLLKVVALVLVAASANAAGGKGLADQFSGQGYGMAGCGLGSIVFGAKPGAVQVLAATTNGIWGNQTIGITVGTSNCDIPKAGQSAAVYIEANRVALMKEAARGSGDALNDLALIYNCTNAQSFSSKVQGNYQQIFKSTNAYDSSREIINTIKADSTLAADCQIAG